MSIGAGEAFESRGARRRRGWIEGIAVAGAALLALAFAAPAFASSEATATSAPIGAGGSYVVTVNDTGTEPIKQFIFTPGETPPATNAVPSPACQPSPSPVPGSMVCNLAVAPGASAQMCYTGHAPQEAFPGASMLVGFAGGGSSFIPMGSSPGVASCPVPGFTAGTGAPGTTGSPGTPASNAGGGKHKHHKHKHHKHKHHKHHKH